MDLWGEGDGGCNLSEFVLLGVVSWLMAELTCYGWELRVEEEMFHRHGGGNGGCNRSGFVWLVGCEVIVWDDGGGGRGQCGETVGREDGEDLTVWRMRWWMQLDLFLTQRFSSTCHLRRNQAVASVTFWSEAHGGGLWWSETWMRQNQAVVSVTFQSEACQATPRRVKSESWLSRKGGFFLRFTFFFLLMKPKKRYYVHVHYCFAIRRWSFLVVVYAIWQMGISHIRLLGLFTQKVSNFMLENCRIMKFSL